jgi:hypothetical protein
MYHYTAQLRAPRLVEFQAKTPQGHRVVRILLDNPENPRHVAFNVSSSARSPAMLFHSELLSLIEQAREITKGNT